MHIHPRPANPSQSGTWVGKVFGSGWPLSPRHPASIPQPPAPRPGGGGGAHRAKAAETKGDFASHILLTFFFLNVKKLNACFECLIRLSSFCHLFCFVMHYIQLHISNPQILPRHQNTCQAFTFRSRRIKGLSRLAHIAEQRDALASPAAAMLRTWKTPPHHRRGPALAMAMPHLLPGVEEGAPAPASLGWSTREGTSLHPGLQGAQLSISPTEITFHKSPAVNQLTSQILAQQKLAGK